MIRRKGRTAVKVACICDPVSVARAGSFLTTMPSKRVAVIGAGASGLPAIKCCRDEGLDVVCFERTDDIGGLWNYTREVREGQACVAKSTVINTSKEMSCYSDFLMPKEFPIFMPNTHMLKYFRLYADHFNLRKYVRFNTEVLSIKPSSDHASSGKWDVQSRDKGSGKEQAEQYDAVLICTGHHADTNLPTFPGMDKFKGQVLHSHDYKTPEDFIGKRVVVVGCGNSGGDVSVELSRFCDKVFLSTRRGVWVMYRIDDKGDPFDTILSTRFKNWFISTFPNYNAKQLQKKLNDRLDHDKYSLRPPHNPFQAHPTVNDEMPNRIANGSLAVRSNIKCFTETGVQFEDGTMEENIAAVVLCTGYRFGFPFLDKKVMEVKDNKINMYKNMFLPDRDQQTLAIIGCFQPVGALMPISELQCRIAARVFTNQLKLPSRDEMWENIRMKQNALQERYVTSLRHTIQVDYIAFMDELATLNGCKPNILKLAVTDPSLAYQCLFGPCAPPQYRLMGPGAWKGARDAVMKFWERNDYPLKSRPLTEPNQMSQESMSWAVPIFIVLVAFVFYFFWL